MGKFRMLWFLLWHARCCDSLSWKMLVMMEGFAVYGGVKPDKARSLVVGLTDESPYLEQVTVGHVVESVVEEQLGPKHPLLLSFFQGRLSKMQSGFGNQGMADTTMFFQLVSQRFSFPHKKNAAGTSCGSDKRK